jgi:hypothetical protein
MEASMTDETERSVKRKRVKYNAMTTDVIMRNYRLLDPLDWGTATVEATARRRPTIPPSKRCGSDTTRFRLPWCTLRGMEEPRAMRIAGRRAHAPPLAGHSIAIALAERTVDNLAIHIAGNWRDILLLTFAGASRSIA